MENFLDDLMRMAGETRDVLFCEHPDCDKEHKDSREYGGIYFVNGRPAKICKECVKKITGGMSGGKNV